MALSEKYKTGETRYWICEKWAGGGDARAFGETTNARLSLPEVAAFIRDHNDVPKDFAPVENVDYVTTTSDLVFDDDCWPILIYRLNPEKWGDDELFSWLFYNEMEYDVRQWCKGDGSAHHGMVLNWTFPDDGLQRGRDYTIEESMMWQDELERRSEEDLAEIYPQDDEKPDPSDAEIARARRRLPQR